MPGSDEKGCERDNPKGVVGCRHFDSTAVRQVLPPPIRTHSHLGQQWALLKAAQVRLPEQPDALRERHGRRRRHKYGHRLWCGLGKGQAEGRSDGLNQLRRQGAATSSGGMEAPRVLQGARRKDGGGSARPLPPRRRRRRLANKPRCEAVHVGCMGRPRIQGRNRAPRNAPGERDWRNVNGWLWEMAGGLWVGQRWVADCL